MKLTLLFVFFPLFAHALIGGAKTPEDYLKSTAFNSFCTLAKIGNKMFMTAAHCVANPFGDIRSNFKKDSSQEFKTHYGVSYKVSINESIAHPTYVKEVKKRTLILKKQYDQETSEDLKSKYRTLATNAVYAAGFESYDVALFTINEETPLIPIAEIDFSNVEPFEIVTIGGYGCTQNLYDDNMSEFLKSKTVSVLGDEFLIYDYQKRNLSNVLGFNFITTGMKAGNGASICLGDSGGPVYLKDSNQIVGINSNYIFSDSSGISYVNTHTKLSSLQDWIEEFR